jgi:hypothetical protein
MHERKIEAFRPNKAPKAAGGSGRSLGLGLVLFFAALSGGCGSGGEASAAMVGGLPKCDPSLLHPRITVGPAAGMPGKLIVYVDGVMACLDDTSRVDQLLSQVEGHTAPASRP